MEGIAYRMLGSMTDAEDVVQDAWFRWVDTRLDEVDSPTAYLATTVSRLCIDRLRKRKVEKLNYVGTWLPEPVQAEVHEEPEARLLLADSVSYAFLFLLEKLNPHERAVFILKEAFGIDHEAVAGMLDIQVTHSRQLLRRARTKMADWEGAVQPAKENARAVIESFVAAAESGDVTALAATLSDDVISYSDGGGRASAALIPLYGISKVTTVLLHLISRQSGPLRLEWMGINGDWGFVAYEGDQIHSVTTAVVVDGKIERLFVMRNPDKLNAFAA